MLKIDKKIVGYSVKKEDAEEKQQVQHMHENIPRPETLTGTTYKVTTPLSSSSIYITINDIVLNPGTPHEQRRPYEIFLNSRNMDHFQWIVALTRVISAVFRKGGDVVFLVDQLKNVFDPNGGYFKSGGKYMPSLVAELGDIIERHLRFLGLVPSGEEPALVAKKKVVDKSAETASVCPKCGERSLVLMEGCRTCMSCGHSKCG